MMSLNNKIVLGFLVILSLPLIFDSCKKGDSSFEPVKIERAEDKISGKWKVISTNGAGTIRVLGKEIPAIGTSKDEPEGFYELNTSPYEYNYNLKTTLVMEAAGLSQDYEYDDKDAGTWNVSEDEESVVFVGNQGITQTLFFTLFDSNAISYLELAIPIDTTLNGLDYQGTIFLKMIKEN
jgi:hypothetical protein